MDRRLRPSSANTSRNGLQGSHDESEHRHMGCSQRQRWPQVGRAGGASLHVDSVFTPAELPLGAAPTHYQPKLTWVKRKMLSTNSSTSWPSSSRKYSATVRPVSATRARAPVGNRAIAAKPGSVSTAPQPGQSAPHRHGHLLATSVRPHIKSSCGHQACADSKQSQQPAQPRVR